MNIKNKIIEKTILPIMKRIIKNLPDEKKIKMVNLIKISLSGLDFESQIEYILPQLGLSNLLIENKTKDIK